MRGERVAPKREGGCMWIWIDISDLALLGNYTKPRTRSPTSLLKRGPAARIIVHERKRDTFVLGREIILVSGLLKIVPAVAYHFCLSLPATFLQPRTCIIPQSSCQYSLLEERYLERHHTS